MTVHTSNRTLTDLKCEQLFNRVLKHVFTILFPQALLAGFSFRTGEHKAFAVRKIAAKPEQVPILHKNVTGNLHKNLTGNVPGTFFVKKTLQIPGTYKNDGKTNNLLFDVI